MIRLTAAIPKRCSVAVSGGADSLCLLDFVARSGREVVALHYDHGTGSTSAARETIAAVCDRYGVELRTSEPLVAPRPRCYSRESWWREQRYQWLQQQSDHVLTAHNLNDQAETWLMGSIQGQPKLIESTIQWGSMTVSRPLLATSRRDVETYCVQNGISWWDDPANTDHDYLRVRVRETVLPAALAINPGLLNTLRKKTLDLAAARSYTSETLAAVVESVDTRDLKSLALERASSSLASGTKF